MQGGAKTGESLLGARKEVREIFENQKQQAKEVSLSLEVLMLVWDNLQARLNLGGLNRAEGLAGASCDVSPSGAVQAPARNCGGKPK